MTKGILFQEFKVVLMLKGQSMEYTVLIKKGGGTIGSFQ